MFVFFRNMTARLKVSMLENEAITLCRNVGKQLSSYAASYAEEQKLQLRRCEKETQNWFGLRKLTLL
jgi:hypothetical protein